MIGVAVVGTVLPAFDTLNCCGSSDLVLGHGDPVFVVGDHSW
jgi:hypothetical protein